jgi:PAS domain S-box-containing protein
VAPAPSASPRTEAGEATDGTGRERVLPGSRVGLLDRDGTTLAPGARYLTATLLVGAALGARLAMLPADGGFEFVTFYPAVTASALLFGIGPALLTLFASAALALYFFMPPFWSGALRADQIAPLATYLLSGGLLCYLAHRLQRAVRGLRASNDTLQASVDSARNSERALRIAEQRMRTVANHVPAMIGYWDRDLKCRFANAEYRAWFGVTPEQALGMRMPDLLGEDVFKLNEPYVNGVLAGQPQHFQRALVKRDGSRGYTDARYVPDVNDHGAVQGFFVLVSDITELHASYSRIRELAQRLESVREEERRSVSRTLHEGIAQDLFAARLMVGRLDALTKGRFPESEACRELVAALERCMEAARQEAIALRPPAFAHLGLEQALEEYALHLGQISELSIRVHTVGSLPPLDEATGLMFFRAAQEALANVVKHARARTVDITLRTATDGITLEISDDGIGIGAAAQAKPGALGLLGIRERFAARGGTVDVRPAGTGGTTVAVHLPVASLSPT